MIAVRHGKRHCVLIVIWSQKCFGSTNSGRTASPVKKAEQVHAAIIHAHIRTVIAKLPFLDGGSILSFLGDRGEQGSSIACCTFKERPT